MFKNFLILIVSLILIANLLSAQEIDKRFDSSNEIRCGETQTIVWDSTYFNERVDIYLWNGTTSSETLIDTAVLNANQKYLWTIPVDHQSGNHFRIKVQRSEAENKYISSTSFFKILPVNPQSIVSGSDEKYKNKGQLVLYPNPTNAILIIDCNLKIKSIEVHNLTGKLIEKISPVNQKVVELNTSKLASGTYYLEVITIDDKKLTERFLVKK